MSPKDRLEKLVGIAARRPRLTALIVAALVAGGALLSLGLKPSAATDTLVSRSASSYQATVLDHKEFGGDAVIVLIREPLTDLVETKDLATVSELEACFAGQVVVPSQQLESFEPAPAGALPPYGGYKSPCGKLMKYKPVQVVYGPGTFLNRAVAAVNEQIHSLVASAGSAVKQAQSAAYQLALGRGLSRAQATEAASAAGKLENQQQITQLSQLYLNSGINGQPRIDDPQFIPQIVFDNTRGVNQPKARFSYLFPTRDSAIIQVRLKAGLTDDQQARAISWIRQAVAMPMFRSGYGGRYTVTGEPVVVHDLASEITGSIAILLIGAVIVMAVTLLAVFRSSLRLLPLVIALAAAAITFGATALVGASLTMASIAVLPILIGLAVDYAIQFQSRSQEASDLPAAEAVARAARVGAPTIGAAALATATGFLVLLLSPVPMVRGFGLLLVIGIAVAFVCALTAGSAALVLSERSGAAPAGRAGGALLGAATASLRGAGEILADAARSIGNGAARLAGKVRPRQRLRRIPTGRILTGRIPIRRIRRPARSLPGVLTAIAARPGRVVVVGLTLALAGWIADTQTAVQSDVTKLVPSSMPALRHLRTLENVTGVSGEIDVVAHGKNVATPETISWMIGYENKLLAHFGYLESKGCAAATLCPALSLPDLFSAGTGSVQSGAPDLSSSAVNSLLAAVPRYFSQAVITPDHRNASLAFGIRLMPLSKQQRVIDYMNSQLHPPTGVTAELAGLPVLAADANAALSSSSRRLLTLVAGLLAVGLVLLAVFRDRRRAIVPLIPIALATGWSALILFLIGIPLNPMSATLGALVIAISTEFSVLLSERFGQERAGGADVPEALARTYQSTGSAVLASGVTAIAGFGVLILSNFTMLRDFGFVTLIDMSVSLAGVLLVLPAVLVLVERGDVELSLGERARRLAGLIPGRRRRARVA